MDLVKVKSDISQRTGIPPELLNGDTAEECIKQAEALLNFRKQENDGQTGTTRQMDPRQSFINFMGGDGTTQLTPEEMALSEYKESLSNYPKVADTSEAYHETHETVETQFSNFINKMF